MNGALVVLLALVWALVLLPGALRSRRSSPTSSVGTFERAMDVLARRDGGGRNSNGRYVYVPSDAAAIVGDRRRRRSALIVHRRRMFTRLVVVTGALLPVATILGGSTWVLFVLSLGALGAYVALLLQLKVQADQAAEVVRRLPEVDRAREVVHAQRVAVGGGAPPDDQLYGSHEGLQVATHPDEPWRPQSGVRIRRWED